MRSPFSVAADARTAAPSPTNAVSRLSGLGTFVPPTRGGLWTVKATHNSASSSPACSVMRVRSGLLGSCRAAVQQSAARRHIGARLSRCAQRSKVVFWSCLGGLIAAFATETKQQPVFASVLLPLVRSRPRLRAAARVPTKRFAQHLAVRFRWARPYISPSQAALLVLLV